ncbi:glycosyltransferase [Luteimonas deserti]|uniref:glycosyltransferase n=1 Tax=Luteimonas deserti TaxID=2752306 RepID=UPI002E2994BD|nr:glycosyltransferase [Luteimonas deserti]
MSTASAGAPTPRIACVIPAWNEADYLPATLAAWHAAVDALALDCELLVADDASTDATAAIAQAAGARVLHVAHRQIGATRNAGAAATTAPWLLFLDADTQVDARLLRAALDALAAGAVGGGCTVRLDGPHPSHVRLGVWAAGIGFRYTGVAPGCFLFCSRAAFDAVGGFDPAWYAGEDIAMSRALARQGRFVILRETVRTSGRKLAHASAWRQLGLLLRFARRGTGMLRDRDALDLWYGGRDGRPPR